MNEASTQTKPTGPRARPCLSHRIASAAFLAILLLALFFRCGGLYRGLNSRHYCYHPDSPKQIAAASKFMTGQYIWYTGSWFYDGYPYGLNHVDALMLRPILAVRDGARRLLAPGAEQQKSDLTLYHWIRLLRVFYGMLCALLVYLTCRLLHLGRVPSLFASAVVGLSPLAISVSHTATGDIGVDLFVSLLMLALAFHVRRPNRPVWIALASVFAGMAFSCKYQGLLSAFCIAFVVLAESVRAKQFVRLIRRGLGAFLCCLVGVVLLKPELLLQFDRAWDNMIENFVRIKAYNVPPAFEALPLHQQLLTSWGSNLPRLSNALYLLLLVSALAASIYFVWRLFQHRRSVGSDNVRSFHRDAVCAAVALLPFVVMALAISGKPKLHPFHFSFLVPVLAVAGAAVLHEIRLLKPWLRRGLYVLSFLLLLVMLRDSVREHFFWTRDDTIWWEGTFAKTVLEVPFTGEKRGIKQLDVEPESPSVFRNRRLWSVGRAPELTFWKSRQVLPLPSVPYPHKTDWIFCNGPVFLRNDRAFRVRKGSRERRELVFANRVETLTLGIRTGAYPSAITLKRPARTQLDIMPAHTQHVVRVPATGWIESSSRDGSVPIWILPLELSAHVGDGWISVLDTPAECERFELYGGHSTAPPHALISENNGAQLARAVAGVRMVEWGDFTPALDHGRRTVLPAGVYQFTCDIYAKTAGSVCVSIGGVDAFPMWEGVERSSELRVGETRVSFQFSKPYAPYEIAIGIKSEAGDIQPTRCTIKPDAARILADLKQWEESGARPEWLSEAADAKPLAECAPTVRAVRFGRRLMMHEIKLPLSIRRGDRLVGKIRMELLDRKMQRLGENHLFLHLYDAEGHQVHVGGCHLTYALAASQLGRCIAFDKPITLPPGEYAVRLGIWNGRTKAAWSISSEGPCADQIHDDYVVVSTLTVTE